jgi:hypothetical protein
MCFDTAPLGLGEWPVVVVARGEPIELRLGPATRDVRAWVVQKDFSVRGSRETPIADLPTTRVEGSDRRWRVVVTDGVPPDGAILRFEPRYRDWDNDDPPSFALRIAPEAE